MQEYEAGRLLTKEEVENMWDNDITINLPEDIVISMTTEIEYNGIYPENVYTQ